MNEGLEKLKTIRHIHDMECGKDERINKDFDIIEKELKNKEKYENLIQELCNYLGLDNLFPYDNLEEIEKEIKTMADNSHWYIANKNQKALEIMKDN